MIILKSIFKTIDITSLYKPLHKQNNDDNVKRY